MKKRAWIFRTLLIAMLLVAQHGAIAHALQHTAELAKTTENTEFCAQCLEFAQLDSGPASLDLPALPTPASISSPKIKTAPQSVLTDASSANFQARAPPLSFT